MREFFIDWAERLIGVLVVVILIGVLIAGVSAMLGPDGGFLLGLFVMVTGALYALIMGGMLYLAFGIYRNTQETSRLLGELLRK